MDKKIPKSRIKKEAVVSETTKKLSKAKAIVFTNYQGMTHKQLEELKKSLKEINAELVITKNTLLKIALQQTQNKETNLSLQQPTATLFAYEDIVAPLKALAKSIKNIKLPIIKFGIFENKLLAEQDITRLSTLPTRDVLIAQVVGGMKSPLFGLHRALTWNMQKLVITLKAIEKIKTK